MNIARLSLIVFFTLQTAWADPSVVLHTVREALPGGGVRVKIIQEDLSLRDDQSQISQKVISEKIYANENVQKNDFETLTPPPLKFPGKGRPLWIPVKNEWSDQDEDDYSKWFATEVDTDFNSGTGLMADCADVGFLFRWVYARNHKLPMASTLSASGKLFGHFSSSEDWDQLPENADWKKDERLKAALRYLFDNTYTQTIDSDLYPTLVNSRWVRPGSMFMILRPKNGHTQTIAKISNEDGIRTYWGNEPSAESIFETGIIIEFQNKEGFKFWRKVKLIGSGTSARWTLVPAAENDGYSLEQYKSGITSESDFVDWTYEHLGLEMSVESQMYSVSDAFITNLSLRMNVAALATAPCVVQQCSPSGRDYDLYSTFSRDTRLKVLRQKLIDLMEKLGSNDDQVQSTLTYYKRKGELLVGTGLTYIDFLQKPELIDHLNSDPRVSFGERWGISQTQDNTNLGFYLNTDALKLLLKQRNQLVLSAAYTCQEDPSKCAANTETGKSLNTSVIDSGVKTLTEKSYKWIDSRSDTTIFQQVRDSFKVSLYGPSESSLCSEPTSCNFDDVIFKDDARKRLQKWSPLAADPLDKRWGLY